MYGAQSLIAVASLLAAESTSPVWHFWLAVPIALGAIAVVIGVLLGYVFKVTRTRFPKGEG
jgi:hypothetical protein